MAEVEENPGLSDFKISCFPGGLFFFLSLSFLFCIVDWSKSPNVFTTAGALAKAASGVAAEAGMRKEGRRGTCEGPL